MPTPHPLIVALRQQHKRGGPAGGAGAATVGDTVHRPENLRRALLPFTHEAGIPWLGFHRFRHGFASMLIAGGRNIVQISRLLGHHSPSFTLNVYAKLVDEGVGGPLELNLTPGSGSARSRRPGDIEAISLTQP